MALNATKLQFCGPVFIAKMRLHFLEKEFSKIFIIKANKLNISNLSIHEQSTIRFLHKNNCDIVVFTPVFKRKRMFDWPGRFYQN